MCLWIIRYWCWCSVVRLVGVLCFFRYVGLVYSMCWLGRMCLENRCGLCFVFIWILRLMFLLIRLICWFISFSCIFSFGCLLVKCDSSGDIILCFRLKLVLIFNNLCGMCLVLLIVFIICLILLRILCVYLWILLLFLVMIMLCVV